jgi:hypothetical protein
MWTIHLEYHLVNSKSIVYRMLARVYIESLNKGLPCGDIKGVLENLVQLQSGEQKIRSVAGTNPLNSFGFNVRLVHVVLCHADKLQ